MQRAALPALIAAALAAPLPAPAEDPVALRDHLLLRDHLAFADSPRGHDADAWRRWAEDFSREMRHGMGAMFAPRMGGKVVKGAPYSAQMITETHQMLADGNVISRRKTGAVYRDGEGRTRQESGAEGRERSVFIHDPVAGAHYVLSPGSRSAVATTAAPRAMSFVHGTKEKHVQVVRAGGSEIRVENGKVTIDGKEAGPGRVEVVKGGKTILVENGKVTIDGREIGHGHGPGHTVVTSVDTSDGTRREEIRVQVVRSPDGREIALAPPAPAVPPVPPVPPVAMAPVPVPPLPGVHTLRFESTAKLGKGATTALGTKDFDGVKAEGKSTVWTIAAGEIGNRDPITITSETWYSPELQVTVHSRHHDPRTGESIYRLASIRRGEPPADLFRVPEDYRMKGRAPGG